MGGVTGGVRFPLVWRGGVGTLLRHRPPASVSDSLGCAFFLTASCSRRAASVMNLGRRTRGLFLRQAPKTQRGLVRPHQSFYLLM